MIESNAKPAPTPAVKAVQREIGQRWTPQIAQAGWTPVSDYFLKNCYRLKVSPTEAMVIIQLMSFKWDAKSPYPGLKTIATRMGITATSVRSHIRKLEKRGYLSRQFIIGATNRFNLKPLFAVLETMMNDDEVAAKAIQEAELAAV